MPAGIIFLSTAIGTVFGQPIIGLGFGAWFAGKMSPEKLGAKLVKGSKDDE